MNHIFKNTHFENIPDLALSCPTGFMVKTQEGMRFPEWRAF